MFWGETFTFDGVNCEQFNLMIYEMSDYQISDGEFAGVAQTIEEWPSMKYKPIHYGVQFSQKLEFDIIFGLNCDRIDRLVPLSVDEADRIATWLIGHEQYKYLQIHQGDMTNIRFRCMITTLEQITYGRMPWAFKATVTCDGPFAYRFPSSLTFQVNGSATFEVVNMSSYHGYYRPVIEYKPKVGGGDLIIVNETDGGRTFELKNMPTSVLNVTVDNDTLVIRNNAGLNLYNEFNKKALRLKRGSNILSATGNGELIFHCEFPINVSG